MVILRRTSTLTIARMPGFTQLIPVILCAVMANTPLADDVRPGLVEINELAEHSFAVRWAAPEGIGWRGGTDLAFPDDCTEVRASERSRVYDCLGGLSGKTIEFAFTGIARPIHTVVRLRLLSGEQHTKVLIPRVRAWHVPPRESFGRIIRDYVGYGLVHIFKGLDHLLFVLCLIWIAGEWRRIVWTITAFTIAHSLTLVLSALNLLRLAVPPVEAGIALSVAFLASEVIRGPQASLTWRYPATVAAAFGLVHGLGFASVLADIGLPQIHLLSALVSFNIGVEIGQILFALPIALTVWLVKRQGWRIGAIRQTVGYLVGGTAAFWVFERVIGFL